MERVKKITAVLFKKKEKSQVCFSELLRLNERGEKEWILLPELMVTYSLQGTRTTG